MSDKPKKNVKKNIKKKDKSNEKKKSFGKKEKSFGKKEKSSEKYKKKNIPKSLKIDVWNKYFSKLSGKCICCGIRKISAISYEAGHIVAEKEGGKTDVNNLVPVCGTCNKSMSIKNLKSFMKESYNRDFDAVVSKLQFKKTTGKIIDKISEIVGIK